VSPIRKRRDDSRDSLFSDVEKLHKRVCLPRKGTSPPLDSAASRASASSASSNLFGESSNSCQEKKLSPESFESPKKKKAASSLFGSVMSNFHTPRKRKDEQGFQIFDLVQNMSPMAFFSPKPRSNSSAQQHQSTPVTPRHQREWHVANLGKEVEIMDWTLKSRIEWELQGKFNEDILQEKSSMIADFMSHKQASFAEALLYWQSTVSSSAEWKESFTSAFNRWLDVNGSYFYSIHDRHTVLFRWNQDSPEIVVSSTSMAVRNKARAKGVVWRQLENPDVPFEEVKAPEKVVMNEELAALKRAQQQGQAVGDDMDFSPVKPARRKSAALLTALCVRGENDCRAFCNLYRKRVGNLHEDTRQMKMAGLVSRGMGPFLHATLKSNTVQKLPKGEADQNGLVVEGIILPCAARHLLASVIGALEGESSSIASLQLLRQGGRKSGISSSVYFNSISYQHEYEVLQSREQAHTIVWNAANPEDIAFKVDE